MSDDESDDLDESGADDPVVDRSDLRESREDAKKKKVLIWGSVGAAVAVVVILVTVAVTLGGSEEPEATTTTTTTSSTTTSTTTTIAPELATAVMPLTGLPVVGEDPATAAILESPSLAVKIDNDPAAQPYVGVDEADIVMELRVEGISRNIAVFHSRIPEIVGPVRSARTSDPDLLAMLVKPIFSWSGGNPTVMKMIRSTSWLVDANHSAVARDYFREKSRKAPFNLMIRARDLLDDRAGDALPPHQLFEYVPHDEESKGVATSRVATTVGATRADFDWDPGTGKWVRQDRNGPRLAQNGEPMAATNVVVLATVYTRSAADSKSPEAISVGEGLAWVFADGKVTAGRWTRAERSAPWSLTADDGTTMRLMPGNTWILLPDPSAGTPVVF